MKKTRLMAYAALAIALVIGTYFIANRPQPTPSPTAEDWVGISAHALSAQEARLVNASGASWIRVDACSDFEEAVTNARAYDLKVLGILDSWMFNKSMDFTLEEWQKNVTHYVSKYNDQVDAWEIWNEPANPNWTITAEKYFSMVQNASAIIRQYDPSAKIVLFGGLNLWSGGGDPHLALDKDFAEKLAELDIAQYGDAISVHAYPWMNPVESRVWETYTDSLAYYRELFGSSKSLEVWVTETGFPLESGREEAQANYLNAAFEYFNGKVTRVFWYSLVDSTDDPGSFGLIGNQTLRQAYYMLQENITRQADW